MNERKITIQEEAPGASKVKTIKPETRVDLQDIFVVLGFATLVGGTSFINWKIGLMLAGVLFFAAAYLIERQKRVGASKK